MVKKLKWNYEVCITYLNMLFTDVNLPIHLTTKTTYVDLLCQKLNKVNEEETYKPEDLLSNIFRFCTNNKELNFIIINIPQGEYKKFFQSKEKLITLNKLKLKENLVKACLLQQKEFQVNFESILYNDSISLKSNINELMINKEISELEAYSIFYNQNDIFFENNNAVRNIAKEKFQEIDSSNSNLNYLREEIAEVFNHRNNEYNLFLLNDGTGSGKTYNVVMNFIKSYRNKLNNFNEDRKSLIFIAPQKNQLFIDETVFQNAKEAEIPLLYARSREDLVNLDSKNYLNFNKEINSFNTVKNFFDELFKGVKNSEKKIDKIIIKLYEEREKKRNKTEEEIDLEKVPSLEILYTTYKYYRDFENNHITEKKYNNKWYEDSFLTAKNNFLLSLNNLAKFFAVHLDDVLLGTIINSTSIYKGFDNFKNLFGLEYKLYEVAYKILMYVMPFEIAKHINCVIYLTGDKSQTLLPISEVSKINPKIKINKYYELEEIVSSNEFGIFVKTSDYEFINSVCDNIISFSPKLIMLKDYLKTIKIILNKGADYLLVSKDNKDYKEHELKYSLYDFFQIILTVLYVCKECSQQLRGMLYTEKEKNNQNVSLYHLLNLAHDNKEFLNNLFTSSLQLSPNDNVNFQFAYFLTKIGFNFIFPDYILNKEFNKDAIPVEPNIFIIKELPEVNLLQILNNKRNKVFLLSATRGFNNIFSGNYSEYFFKEINKYIPNKIKIFQREKQQNNPMPKFIEDRFNRRKSIEVIKLNIKNNKTKINNMTDLVEETTYKIDQILLKNLDKNNDITFTKKIYPLFSNLNSNKNYLENLIINVKHTQNFLNLTNPYSKAEILGILNSLIHAYENNENSIIMTLSNRFKDFLNKEDFLNNVFKGIKTIRDDDENKYKVFEYNPISGSNKKLRLIFFDALLGKTPNLKDHFIVEKDTIIVLISSYISAGTGLNLTLEDKENKQSHDFNSIYFVSTPYYTSVMDENGYGHLSNQLLIYKYFAHTGNKTIDDLSEGLSSTAIKSILVKEHTMEKVKALMQSAGRIERRDSKISTKIYFVENEINSIFEESMSNFNEMFKLHANQHSNTIVANFSMLNKSLVKSSLNHINNNSLTMKEKNILENISKQQYKVFQSFFCDSNNFPKMLNQYRLANPDFIWVKEFNTIFRNYTSPTYDLKKELILFIGKNESILKKANCFNSIKSLLDNIEFDFIKHQVSKDKIITIDYQNLCYSDYSNNIKLINDKYFFNYGEHINLSEIAKNEDFLKNTIKLYSTTMGLTKLPNIYLSHIIRGNIGESILSDYFKFLKIEFNDIEKKFNKSVDQQLYELFDFYVIKNKTIYCIDTKNWSLYNDNGAKKTLLTFPEKINKIKKVKELNGYKLEFVYLNMFPNLNSAFTNGLSVHLGKYPNTHYINFITKKPIYELIKINNTEYMKNKEVVYSINEEWRNLI